MRALLPILALLSLAGCGDPAAWERADALAAAARAGEGAEGWSHPLWVDVARECSRVMPWHDHYDEARALRESIEAGRTAALSQPVDVP